MLERKLDSSVMCKLARCTRQLQRQVRTRELAEFVNEQAELPLEIQAELDAASAAVDAACTTARHLSRPRALPWRQPRATPCSPMQPRATHACVSRLQRHASPRLMPRLASSSHVPCCPHVPTPNPNPNQVRLLAPEPLEELRLADDVDSMRFSDALRESIEAAAVILGVRPDFSTAQARPMPMDQPHANEGPDPDLNLTLTLPLPLPLPLPLTLTLPLTPNQARLMPKEGSFRERLLGFDRGAVPPTARTRLRRFISAEGGGGGGGGGTGGAAAGKAAAPVGLAAVAAAVRAWCSAMLRHKAAMEEAEMAREQTSCTVAMQVGYPYPYP